MAIRALNSVVVANYPVLATADWQAGCALFINATTGNAEKATRAGTNSDMGKFIGFSADDTARTGNTMILADPVGSNYINNSGTLVDNNTGFYAVAKRAIGDFQSEIVNGVTNPSAQSSGYEGPRRGVGVYNTPGGQFVTDQYALVTTNGTTTDAGAVWTPAPGDLCTCAATSGKLVKIGTPGTDGAIIARVDKYDSAAGLLYFTQLSSR